MKILMINKFLHPNGGSENYIFKLGMQFEKMGHEVQFFGMEHEERIVGNRLNAYTSNMDFHNKSMFVKLTYPIKTIYSTEARKKIRLVLDDFQPNVCHINNFNYQLTPSIILEIRKWERQSGHHCRIVYTAHDHQLVCPNHMCRNPHTGENCEKCLNGSFISCVKGKCIHGSAAKSIIGALEASFWKMLKVYQNFDSVISCSEFLKKRLDTNPVLADKSVVMHNFVDIASVKSVTKKEYVLYFGRYSEEKGTATMVQAAQNLPDIPFIFAGSGPLEHLLEGVANIKNVGFQKGEDLERLIREARFTVVPSECYENCPFSVMESQMYRTPVLGADIGGIPELIQVGITGELFESGNLQQLIDKIQNLWNDKDKMDEYTKGCEMSSFDSIEDYTVKLLKIYQP